MSKRIVFHTASLRGGGAERVFVLIANEMACRGHDVTFLTWNAEGPNATMLLPQVNLLDLGLPIRNEGYGKPATVLALFKTARFLRRLRPDAVYSAPEFANLVIALALLMAGSRARFFPSFHAAAALPASGLGARIACWLSRFVGGRATRAIAVSRGVGGDIVARGIAASKVVIINNPLPPAGPRPVEPYPFEGVLASMGGGPVIGTLGRLVAVKDHRTLLKAFAGVRQTRDARLVIFGEGPLKWELRNYADELGIGEDVLLAGYVNDPAACYACCKLFVLSSTSEGFGNVLIEAMAAGVPVVSTDAPHGPREILEDGRFGRLVPVGDAAALTRAIIETLAKPDLEALLKARASDFAIDKIADRYESLLDMGASE
jgi:glycosyltransferase involved in cell wall biosynthesis